MKFQELLKMCKEQPGCIKTKEQMEVDSLVRYKNWAARVDKAYNNEISQE